MALDPRSLMDSFDDLSVPKSREDEKASPLAELNTSWTLVGKAHIPGPQGQAAMEELIGRYHDAVKRYLELKLRDRHLAEEVLQEFWTKLLTHKLAGADHSKGRFRDYLRTVLHRLVIDHFRGRKYTSLPPGELLDPTIPDLEFERVWRQAVIRGALSKLDTYESSTPKNRYAKVLRMRYENPGKPIEDIAQTLSEQTKQEITPEAFRKTLQRARFKFMELLIQEIREGMMDPSPAEVEAEFHDLGLGNLYRRYTELVGK